MNKDVIIACDFASAEETYRFLDKMGDVKPYVKITSLFMVYYSNYIC